MEATIAFEVLIGVMLFGVWKVRHPEESFWKRLVAFWN